MSKMIIFLNFKKGSKSNFPPIKENWFGNFDFIF